MSRTPLAVVNTPSACTSCRYRPLLRPTDGVWCYMYVRYPRNCCRLWEPLLATRAAVRCVRKYQKGRDADGR